MIKTENFKKVEVSSSEELRAWLHEHHRTFKQAGLWDFMDDVDQLIVPEDLLNALDADPGAAAFFHAINDSSKRFVLRWIKLAKTDKTRKSRIQTIAQLSAKREKLKGS